MRTKNDLIALLPVLIFLLLTLPFIYTIPYLDGNIEFVKNFDFFQGGFENLLNNWGSVHPPIKEVIVSLFFRLFGVTVFSYNIAGILLGIVGIISIYFLAKELLGKKQAVLSSLLLASLPLYISVGLFSLNDYFLTVFVLTSLYFYITNKLFLFSIFAVFSALSKETGLILILAVCLVETIFLLSYNKAKKINVSKLSALLLPIFAYLIWYLFLKSQGKGFWSDWNFSEVSNRGTIYTIIHNLVTFNFLNKYAYQNWRQLFILNFNWIYWLIFAAGILSLSSNKKVNFLKLNDIKIRSALIILIFCLGYFFSVLTFQTYTIPRYALPVYPFLMIGVSWSLVKLLPGSLSIVIPSILVFSYITLFKSADPISTSLWGTQYVLGEKMYGVNNYLAGNDGLTYNIQYLTVAKKRTFYFNNEESLVNFDIRDCHWIFLDPRNDIKTASILSIDKSLFVKCKI